MTVEALMARVGADAKARLRWKVLRLLHVAPWERRAKKLTDAQLVWCAAQLLLDARPEWAGVDGGENSGFDLGRFEELRRHEGG